MAGGRLLTMGLLKSNTATLRKRPIRARPSGNLAEAASYRPSNAYSDPSACRRQGCSATPHRERIDRIQIWVVRERGNVRLHLGNQMYNVGRITLDGYSKIKIEQRTYPVKVVTEGERTYWHFQDRFYWENDGLASDEVHALLVSEQQRKRGPPGMGGRSEDRRSS
jgi:hypothetical protein